MALELHPFLEADTRPSPNWWYVLSISGSSPSMRVGHTATFIPALHADEHDRVFIIGGANPEQVFSEVYILNLCLRTWDTLEAPGFRGRYEHAAFCVENRPGEIFVFGGATQTGNLNDIQSLNVSSGIWLDVDVLGTPPIPRTHHTSAVIGPRAYFYSGGHCGPDPVGDRIVHCLDTTTMTWISIAPSGDPPKPRHGHLMVASGNRIFLHGGVSGSTFYDDFFVLDLERNCWTSIKRKKTFPSPRAAHEGIIHNKDIYLFGGMNKSGALDDGYKFNTENNSWSKLQFEGPAPSNRLDFAMCTFRLRVPVHCLKSPQETQTELSSIKVLEIMESEQKPGSATSIRSPVDGDIESKSASTDETDVTVNEQQTRSNDNCFESDKQKEQSNPKLEEVSLILINGGMDTQGEIFDDTLVLLL